MIRLRRLQSLCRGLITTTTRFGTLLSLAVIYPMFATHSPYTTLRVAIRFGTSAKRSVVSLDKNQKYKAPGVLSGLYVVPPHAR